MCCDTTTTRIVTLSTRKEYNVFKSRDTHFIFPLASLRCYFLIFFCLVGQLRTGLALYSDNGRLLEYEHAIFESAEELEANCVKLMAEWEAKYQEQGDDESYHITHVAIEGSDVSLRATWRNIVENILHCQMLIVKPDEWRADLLLSKEKVSGDAAKEASRLIARQLVGDYGGILHEGKFPTDVAEAVLLGYYVSRRLEWIPRKEPSIRRYSNGNVVVPKTIEQFQPLVAEPSTSLVEATDRMTTVAS